MISVTQNEPRSEHKLSPRKHQTPLRRDSVEPSCDHNIISNEVRADLDSLGTLTKQ